LFHLLVNSIEPSPPNNFGVLAMVILFLSFLFGVGADDLHSLLQARSATQLQSVHFVAHFSDKVQGASGVVSVFKEESMMCAMVTRGAQAPAMGIFTDEHGTPRAVHAHFIAPTNGRYCIEDHVFSMLQRSYGIHSAQDAEDAIARKDSDSGSDDATQENQETEQATGGKNGGENTDNVTKTKSGQIIYTTSSTTTTDGPGKFCAGDNRKCCRWHKTCVAGYEPIWDPTCKYANYSYNPCNFPDCYQCVPTGDPILQTPICPYYSDDSHQYLSAAWARCIPEFKNVPWTRGVDYEGNPYRDSGTYHWAACVNDTREPDGNNLLVSSLSQYHGVLCLGSNYRERGCNYNHYVAQHNTTDHLPPNKTIADYEWTGTLCRFLPGHGR